MALRRVVAVIEVVAIDGVDVGQHLIHILGSGMAEPARRHFVLEVRCLAGAQRQIVGGEVDSDVTGRVGNQPPLLAVFQGLVDDVGGNQEDVAEQ